MKALYMISAYLLCIICGVEVNRKDYGWAVGFGLIALWSMVMAILEAIGKAGI